MIMSNNDQQKAEKAVAAAEASVTSAQAVVADLEAKRGVAIRRGTDLADERANVALAAHTGDEKAAKRLEEIHAAIVRHGSELASLDAAIRAAGEKVEMARAALARATERLRILDLKKHNDEVRKLGPWMDRAVADYVGGLRGLLKVPGLGLPHPSTGQQVLMLYRCLLVALRGTPWEREFGVADSNDKRSFGSHAAIIEQWCNANARDFEYRLAALDGAEQKKTEAAA
jgi:hypothetical protein